MVTMDYSMAEGNKKTITVNVVATMLLEILLLPKLWETSVKFDGETVTTFDLWAIFAIF